MNRLAGRAGGDLLRVHDPGLEPAGGDLAAEPLGGRGRRVETDKLAPRGFERRPDAVKAIDERNLGLPPLAWTVAGACALGSLLRFGALPFLQPRGGGRRIARSEGRRTWAAVAFTGHRLNVPARDEGGCSPPGRAQFPSQTAISAARARRVGQFESERLLTRCHG